MATYTGQTLVLNKNGDTYKFDLGNVHYGVCNSDSGVQIHAVSIPEIKGLSAGLCVRILFPNSQTFAGQPKLQINSLTAINIVRNGTTAASQGEWQAGEIVDFIYNGTNFVIVSGSIPTTNTYGGRIKLSSSTSSSSEVLAATPKAVKTAYDLANGKVSCTAANVKTALGVTSNTEKFLREDGTWAEVAAKPVEVNFGTLTTAQADVGTSKSWTISGSTVEKVTSDMGVIWYECSDMSIFASDISITTGAQSIQISATIAQEGTTTFKVRIM